MLPSFCRDTVTVVHPGVRHERGAPIPDWENATETVVDGCSYQPYATTTNTVREHVGVAPLVRPIKDEGRLYMPPGTEIADGDAVLVPVGESRAVRRFLVNGIPMPWRSPTGRVSHVAVELIAYKG